MIEYLKEKNPGEEEFLQAAEEIYESIQPLLEKNERFKTEKIYERMLEPERIITFRVTWLDDNNEVQVNRGYRVQANSAIGPYKGGLRFSPSVTLSVLKFLALEQTLKNALTGLPIGAAKGGADFDPKGKSDKEIMRFCQAFMLELQRHIGHQIDVPAGDMGVGEREIGYMFGAFKKIKNKFTGVLTGKGTMWGGSYIRKEATGYGLIYFAQEMLKNNDDSLEGKTCIISGSGNVSLFAAEKAIAMGAKPIAMSDSSGFIIDKDGIDEEKLVHLKKIKLEDRDRIKAYCDKYKDAEYVETKESKSKKTIWHVKADCAFPCATQNELDDKDAKALLDNKTLLLAEGANMPCTAKAAKLLQKGKILYAPGKASNAGGVAISAVEMTQNRMGVYWTETEVDDELLEVMKRIHKNCLDAAKQYGNEGDYVAGANIYGFNKVSEAMLAQGVI